MWALTLLQCKELLLNHGSDDRTWNCLQDQTHDSTLGENSDMTDKFIAG